MEQQPGTRIARAREAQGLSRAALARLVGVRPPTISRIESGQRRASAPVLHRIAELLHLPADELLEAAGYGPHAAEWRKHQGPTDASEVLTDLRAVLARGPWTPAMREAIYHLAVVAQVPAMAGSAPALDEDIRGAVDDLLDTSTGVRWDDAVRHDVYMLAMRQRARSPEAWLPQLRVAVDRAARQRSAASSGAIGAEAWQQIFIQGIEDALADQPGSAAHPSFEG